jgi:hypothetical protein
MSVHLVGCFITVSSNISGSKFRSDWKGILWSKRVDTWNWRYGTLVYIYNGSHCHSATTGISFGMLCCVWLTQAASVNRAPLDSLGWKVCVKWTAGDGCPTHSGFFIYVPLLCSSRFVMDVWLNCLQYGKKSPDQVTGLVFFFFSFYILSAHKLDYYFANLH